LALQNLIDLNIHIFNNISPAFREQKTLEDIFAVVAEGLFLPYPSISIIWIKGNFH
jgi:hypothetical protein